MRSPFLQLAKVKKLNRKLFIRTLSAKLLSLTTCFRQDQAPNKDFSDTDDKVSFYTGLPSMEVVMVVFEHVSLHATQPTQSPNTFKEFIIVLMKLRLNALLQVLISTFGCNKLLRVCLVKSSFRN